ncbi:transposon Tf2-6 polyprotein [Nephila pilipes]|uniref:Transposon Tf2-6 polyprotein n=1 Tax=Nephila pilipes TaxID=299642 RepID=A0A8X6UDC4_NEPPI|nr:transposon Tf2-6 polyprotein [Nephila pilipes]
MREARELVESFPITNENYPLAIESLTERYGRKELLIDFYVRELLKLVLNNATKKKQDSLSSLYNKLSTQLRALSCLGVTTDQCGVILYPLVESSLPTHILRSFERQRKNIDSEQSISTQDAIVSFLKNEVQSEEKIKLSRSEILPYERECKHLAKSQNTLPAAAELFIQESKDTCAFCFKAHANRFCKRAFFISLEEKIAIIKKKGLRRVCLAKGHLASRCRSQITCQLCSKKHLKFMCPNIVCNKSDSPKQEAALAARKSTRAFSGKDGIIRLVKLRTEKGNALRPIQRLYPLEMKPNYEKVVSENRKGLEVVTEYPELNTDSNKTVPVTSSGREIKPVKRLHL